jgi:hypothetical protein
MILIKLDYTVVVSILKVFDTKIAVKFGIAPYIIELPFFQIFQLPGKPQIKFAQTDDFYTVVDAVEWRKICAKGFGFGIECLFRLFDGKIKRGYQVFVIPNLTLFIAVLEPGMGRKQKTDEDNNASNEQVLQSAAQIPTNFLP